MRKFHIMILKDLTNTVTEKQMWDVFLNSIYDHTCSCKLMTLVVGHWRSRDCCLLGRTSGSWDVGQGQVWVFSPWGAIPNVKFKI